MSEYGDRLSASELEQIIDKAAEAVAIEQDDGTVTHHVTFKDGVTLLCSRELDTIREHGYEVETFGNNLKDADNLTAVFV